ncbi:MAG: hypothetical protein AAF215_31560 [Cyanobacteria bacterium P01_A01_bin.123]
MPLPSNFSSSEHLQDLVKKWYNREVRDFFQDLGADDFDPDLTSPRSSLRVACTHLENDSLMMTHMRMSLFDRLRLAKFQQPYIGIPVSSFQEQRKFKPQIMLYFQEDVQDIEPGYAPVTGEISFRLMQYSHETITPPIAQNFANRINSNFNIGGGYVWRKGKVMVSYSDWGKGYQLQLLCRTEGEGRQLINQVLDIQADAFNESKMAIKESAAPSVAYPTVPEIERVYGESRRLPRRRPIAEVRFQYAVLHIWGLPNPVTLVDRSGTWSNPLVA